jgi:thiol-disulfide isomerase/thioredoxin
MNQTEELNNQVQSHITALIAQHKGTFFADFLKAMQEPELPLIEGNTRADTLSRYKAYKDHFWDNIDLSDDRLIRTPVIHPKVEQYLNRLTSPLPDSLITAVDLLLHKTGNSYEAFKYLMWYLTIKYEGSEIMGYDAIFVHLVDTWYNDPRMDWMNAGVKQNLIARAKTLKPLLIGKPAPEMILFDTLMQPHSLYNIQAKYILIYFWDPDCGHCKKETPLLRDFYKNNKETYDLEVYAVCMDTSWKDMKTYIRKNETIWINVNGFYSMTPDFRELYDVHSSPVMFLLDKKKTIIAKRLLSEQMETYIRQREKMPKE